jgi:hypothetical protein
MSLFTASVHVSREFSVRGVIVILFKWLERAHKRGVIAICLGGYRELNSVDHIILPECEHACKPVA